MPHLLVFGLRFGKALAILSSSAPRMAATVAASGLCAGALEFTAHTLVSEPYLSRRSQTLLDAAVIGILAAVIVLLALTGARARRVLVLDQLRKVADLNHNVRNALQVIVSSTYLAQPENMAIVLTGVEQIEHTLKELFPAMGERGADSPSDSGPATRLA